MACAGQKRLTNVALVRYKKHGMRLEVAAFPNTVLSWRQGMFAHITLKHSTPLILWLAFIDQPVFAFDITLTRDVWDAPDSVERQILTTCSRSQLCSTTSPRLACPRWLPHMLSVQ